MYVIRFFYRWKKSSRRIFYFCFFSLLSAIYALSFATEERNERRTQREVTPPFSDPKVLQELLTNYEELLWLGTKKNSSQATQIPSETIFTKVSPSFDRAFFGIKTVALFLEGRYEDFLEFTSGQPKDKKLEWNEFQDLQSHAKTHALFVRNLSKEETRQLLEFALILDEIKDCETLHSRAWMYEIAGDATSPLLVKLLKEHPEIFPTYRKLSKAQQALLIDLLSLPSLEPILTLTSPRTIFERFQKEGFPKKDPSLLELFIFYSQCLIAKQQSDTTHHYSSTFHTYTHKNFLLIRKALSQLEEHTFDFATQYYITRRGDFLDLDASSPLHRVLIQMAAARNLYTPAEGKALKDTLLKLPVEELSRMINASSDLEKKASHQESCT